MDKIKILHVAECLGSGVLNYVKNLCEWQCREYEVYVAYETRPETPENFKEQFDRKVHFIRVDGFTREIVPRKDFAAFCFLRKLIKEIKPDLIHLHSTKAGIIGRWAINCNKYRVFYSPHAYSFLMMDCSAIKRGLYEVIEKISDRKNCLTVTDIDGELEASRKVTKKAICIANGIHPEEMDIVIEKAKRYESAGKTDKQIICMLGKAVPQKNPGLFNEIAEKFPDCEFLWIGAGPLEHLLTSPNIKVTGWLSREEAMAKIMASDIFLFTSVWESLSIALLEVMYIGKPCVVSTADGNRDVIRNGRNGFVCETKQDYIDALKKLLSDKEMAKQYGRQAHQDIVEKYNVHVMEKKYRELYRKLGI